MVPQQYIVSLNKHKITFFFWVIFRWIGIKYANSLFVPWECHCTKNPVWQVRWKNVPSLRLIMFFSMDFLHLDSPWQEFWTALCALRLKRVLMDNYKLSVLQWAIRGFSLSALAGPNKAGWKLSLCQTKDPWTLTSRLKLNQMPGEVTHIRL